MIEIDKIYSFAFRGLLAEEALDSAGRETRLISANLDPALEGKLSLQSLDESLVADAKHMAVVYVAIAAFENGARKLVQKVLLEQHGIDWWVTTTSQKIREKAESRKGEEEKFKWHTPRGEAPIHYTDFGELASIIRQNWPDFEPYFPSLEWVDIVFDVVERSRNVIMHSGQLAERDIERVGINIRDWIAQVGA
jgi:hypothetical protein